MAKLKKTIVEDIELLEWVNVMIERKEFGSVSHAIEKALFRLREKYKGCGVKSR
ncbi:MAG: hypothetical protein ACETVN_02935 [Asgard group archaeon]